MAGSEWRRGWISEIITEVSLSHTFLIACGPPPAESGLFIASGQVGADGPTIHQVSEFRLFSDHSRGNSLEGQGSSLLQGLRFRRQKRPSELRKAKNLGQGVYPVNWTLQKNVWCCRGGFSASADVRFGLLGGGRRLEETWPKPGCQKVSEGHVLNSWAEPCRGGGSRAEQTCTFTCQGLRCGSRAKFSSIIEKYNTQFHSYTWAGDCENSYSLKQEVPTQFSRDSIQLTVSL